MGYKWVFGIQALICVAAIVPVVFLNIYGHRLRLRYPMPMFSF